MTTLAKRASLRQARVMRIVAGAVMNAAHAHPDGPVDERFARSVSKRAAGTLSAQWPEVLALPSQAVSEAHLGGADNQGARSSAHVASSRGSAGLTSIRPALHRLRVHLGIMAGAARHGRCDRAALHADLVKALRLLAEATA